ncbi:ROK family protein [Actinocrispum wychmicini]|uniref:Glucokinase n=1 Tax=Actinocrispum wychmicini TaxID=1213861 RepID=A0A4R2JBJ0_9PSEU|nr:ROK family protein [Actinocrispum wychmicini]TCO54116.1 glucokinase [Actinocrispum wychmicini]
MLAAVELLPGRVRAALLDLSGTVLRRAESVFDPTAQDRTGIDAALTEVTQGWRDAGPVGVGVAAVGIVDADVGVVVEVNEVPALRGYPLADTLAGLVHAPVHVEHRARLQVLGDRWFGPGQGRSTFASVSTGEVLGVGILHDGRVLAPPGGRSGAHMKVSAGGEVCTCGALGCWKTIATTAWLRAEARRRGLTEMDGDIMDGELLDDYAGNIALGLVNIQQLFAPGLFVLHGEAAGERFRTRIEERLRADSPSGAEPPRVLVNDNPVDDIALLGGAGLVLSRQ